MEVMNLAASSQSVPSPRARRRQVMERRLSFQKSSFQLILLILLCGVFGKHAQDVACSANDASCKIQSEATSASWFDDVTSQGLKFLKSNVFGQKSAVDQSNPFSHLSEQESNSSSDDSKGANQNLFDGLFAAVTGMVSSDKNEPVLLDSLLERARSVAAQGDTVRSFQDIVQVFVNSFKEVNEHMKKTFSEIGMERFNPISMLYYLEYEDERKNPSYKRRKHRFDRRLSTETIYDLHDALYLALLSYVDTVAEVKDGLKKFKNDTWELLYSKTEAFPNEPAHFIAIHKELAPLKPSKISFPWTAKDEALDVIIVVRGTKDFGDMLSDGLLDPADYRGGKAHAGILRSGQYIAEKHVDMLQHLLEVSKRKSIRLWIFGHSLGAGAAAIAAMEFNDKDFISVKAVGFGCPPVLSAQLAESTRDYITTVVADADVVPRMSGAAIANVMLDVMSFDWTDRALVDLEDLLKMLSANPPFDILPQSAMDTVLSWAKQHFEKDLKPLFGKVTKERFEPVLVPPGTCIHLFRDGVSYTGTYTNCSLFKEVDIARTLVDDHFLEVGYHRAFLSLLRDALGNFKVDFEHDISAVPV